MTPIGTYHGPMRPLAMLLLTGCIEVSQPEPARPSRWIATVASHMGVTEVSEPASDGASGPGVAFGPTASIAYRINPRFSVGLGVDLSLSHHKTMTDGVDATYW